MTYMLLGAAIYALGLWSGVFLCRRKAAAPAPPAPAKPADKPKRPYDSYRDPLTNLYSRKAVKGSTDVKPR
jgi:hypothetical protein